MIRAYRSMEEIVAAPGSLLVKEKVDCLAAYNQSCRAMHSTFGYAPAFFTPATTLNTLAEQIVMQCLWVLVGAGYRVQMKSGHSHAALEACAALRKLDESLYDRLSTVLSWRDCRYSPDFVEPRAEELLYAEDAFADLYESLWGGNCPVRYLREQLEDSVSEIKEETHVSIAD